MCGIATAVSPATNIVPALLGGLRKREYTGYDSADVAVLNDADAATLLMGVCSLLLLACNARYHSGVTASYWLESLAGIPCTAKIASEYRYRSSVADPDQLVVAIWQSGETDDTLAALRHDKELGHICTLAICNVPEIGVASNDSLLDKLKSNLKEVQARGGELYVFADADSHFPETEQIHVLQLPEHYGDLSPILHVVPLQLLAYHTALAKGTDVDKPRNLAKSVTVE